MKLLFCALAIAFLLEGIMFALFPSLARQYFLYALSLPEDALRWLGFAAVAVSAGILFFIHLFS